jgi:hypothetical protein
MRVKLTSAALWRCLVVVLAAIGITQFAIELTGASRVLTPGVAAEPLFEGTYLHARGPTTFVVEGLPPLSPLRAMGVQPGDHLRYDAPLGRWYTLAAGEQVSLTVLRGDTARRIAVNARAMQNLPPYTVANYVLDRLTVVIALLLGVIVGWTRTHPMALRALAGPDPAELTSFAPR